MSKMRWVMSWSSVANFIRFPAVRKFEYRLRSDKVTESLKVGTFFETQCIMVCHCGCLYHQKVDPLMRFDWYCAAGISAVIKPMYIYSVGMKLCGTHVRITDLTRQMAPSSVSCFHSLPGHRFTALAFHFHADLLFFAEANSQVIYRMRMETAGEHFQRIAANTGRVGGQRRLSFITWRNNNNNNNRNKSRNNKYT